MDHLVTYGSVTCDSHYCTCLGHLRQHDTDRIISILCHATQGGQAKNSSDCRASLSLTVSLINFAIVNGPLCLSYLSSKKFEGCSKYNHFLL
jgi:hypothetical protein